MRPVNLIPEDQRRGPGVHRKGGPLAYVVVGALVLLLAGVALVVSTNNQISTEKAEVAKLGTETTAAETKAAKLASFTQLRDATQSRVTTVTSLADSRFDWEKVMRELSLILPSDIWLNNLTGTVKPAVTVNNGAAVSIRASVPGPALQMLGCAASQDAVARFVSSLEDIDGVTRVGMQSSERGTISGGAAETDAAGTSESDCPQNGLVTEFEIVAAFDEAPIPTVGGSE